MLSFLALAVLGAVSAAPTPQDIDFDLVYALPDPTYSVAVGATAQAVTYDATTVYEAALEQITATVTSADETLSTDSVGAAGVKKRAACATQPVGYGPVPSPDTASAFVSYAPFAAAATGASAPAGYSQMFTNLKGSSNAYGYLGYTTLKTYDVNACAAKCNTINGCLSINIYYERDPTVDPGTGCTNPASTTVIKCVFWGGPVSAESATNTGQYRSQFQVVIAGSNGYTNNSIASVPGYNTAVALGSAAINAPFDKYGSDTFLGSAVFVGSFNAGLCGKACTEKSQYALENPPTDGSPVQTCQFFNTYILYMNNKVQGQYCAMYSESWPSSYATNVGQTRGSDNFTIRYSFSYSNTTNPGTPNALAAVYQARKDVLWPGNSALPYCSSVLGYTALVTTVISTVTEYTTTTTLQTVDVTVTATATVVKKRGDATLADRAVAIPKPDVLTKYPAAIVTSACSLAVTSDTTTSTTTALTTITPAPVVTTVVTSVSTTTTATVTVAAVPVYDCEQYTCDTGLYVFNACGQGIRDVVAERTSHEIQSSKNACAKSCRNNYCDLFNYNVATGDCDLYFSYTDYTPFYEQGFTYGGLGDYC